MYRGSSARPVGAGCVELGAEAGSRPAIRELMDEAAAVRKRLLGAYEDFLAVAFGDERVGEAEANPADERFACATPGGKPWRRSLIAREQQDAAAAAAGR